MSGSYPKCVKSSLTLSFLADPKMYDCLIYVQLLQIDSLSMSLEIESSSSLIIQRSDLTYSIY